jgi:hypothetical protein
MAVEYRSTRQIAASPDAVWSAVLDVGSWPAWPSGVTKVEGSARDGGKVKVYTDLSPGRAFPVRVAIDQDHRVMRWTGGMPLGLFRGVRTFRVTTTNGGCEVDVHEKFTGPLVGAMSRRMPDLQPSFDTFTDGLKALCERG